MAVQLPIGAEEQFKGVVDLVSMTARVWRDETLGAEYDDVEIPSELRDQAKEYHDKLVEAAAECDEHLFAKYIEGQPITPEEIWPACGAGPSRMKIFPVICGSAFKNKGVQNMLDAIVDLLPSPLDVPPMKGSAIDDPEVEIERRSGRRRAVSALVFKIMTDPFVGQLAFIRVYSGTLTRAIRS